MAAALAVVLSAVFAAVVRGLWRTRPGAASESVTNGASRVGYNPSRETRLVAAEALSALVAFAALGTLAYTALETHVWWLMLAQAVSAAWWLGGSRSSAPTRSEQCAPVALAS